MSKTAAFPILSVAPMMRHSHRHARFLWHRLCPDAMLYTEMHHAAAVLRGGERVAAAAESRMVVLQLAGDDPATLAAAARRGEDLGYAEVNLNCGCPSKRATHGSFGACMMKRPAVVAECVAAIRAGCGLPVSVKCRIGVDEQDTEENLDDFARQVAAAGCETLVVHARKALLKGLDPKRNRSVPALDPARVVRLKESFPELHVVSNGGIGSVAEARARLAGVDGVMLGRAVVARPALLAAFATEWFGRPPVDIEAAVRVYLEYCAARIAEGVKPWLLLWPLQGLVAGQPGAKEARRKLQASSLSGDLRPLAAVWP